MQQSLPLRHMPAGMTCLCSMSQAAAGLVAAQQSARQAALDSEQQLQDAREELRRVSALVEEGRTELAILAAKSHQVLAGQ